MRGSPVRASLARASPVRGSPGRTPKRHKSPKKQAAKSPGAGPRPAATLGGQHGQPANRLPLEERLGGVSGTSCSPSPNRPLWDWSVSDLSRYKSSPAEQLRRQLLRISRHQDEAAKQVHRKLQRMQENISPFVQELGGLQMDGGAEQNRAHMTSCFASQTPTGRLPGSGGGCSRMKSSTPAAQGAASCARKVPGTAHASSRIERARDDVSESAPCTASAILRDPLDAALEAEIDDFVAASCGSGVREGVRRPRARRDCQPQYRFMRRVQSSKEVAHPATTPPASAPTAWSPARASVPGRRHASPSESDSELGEIEDSAMQLEVQLSWWRRRMDSLASTDENSASSTAPVLAQEVLTGDKELSGFSEWLRMSKAGAADMPELPSTGANREEKANESAVTRADEVCPRQFFLFDPMIRCRGMPWSNNVPDLRGDLRMAKSPPEQTGRAAEFASDVATDPAFVSGLPCPEGSGSTSLSQIISRQAAELDSAAHGCGALQGPAGGFRIPTAVTERPRSTLDCETPWQHPESGACYQGIDACASRLSLSELKRYDGSLDSGALRMPASPPRLESVSMADAEDVTTCAAKALHTDNHRPHLMSSNAAVTRADWPPPSIERVRATSGTSTSAPRPAGRCGGEASSMVTRLHEITPQLGDRLAASAGGMPSCSVRHDRETEGTPHDLPDRRNLQTLEAAASASAERELAQHEVSCSLRASSEVSLRAEEGPEAAAALALARDWAAELTSAAAAAGADVAVDVAAGGRAVGPCGGNACGAGGGSQTMPQGCRGPAGGPAGTKGRSMGGGSAHGSAPRALARLQGTPVACTPPSAVGTAPPRLDVRSFDELFNL